MLLFAAPIGVFADTGGEDSGGRAEEETSAKVAEAVLQRHLGLYLTRPERREGAERVRVGTDGWEAWFLRPIGRGQREQAICDAARWLILGRLDGSAGAQALFDAQPDVPRITLVFYAVQTRVEPDARGKYLQHRSAIPHARFTLSRERAARLDRAVLSKTLSGARCAHLAESLLDEVWVRPAGG